MLYRKEQLKYSVVSAVIGSLVWFLIDQIYTALNFSDYWAPYNLSVSLSVFLGVFLVLSILAKIEKPSFSLILPVFLIYFAILCTIIFTGLVISYNSTIGYNVYTLQEEFLMWLEDVIPNLVVFSLIGITAGIMMGRLASKLKYDAFYFVFSSLIGVGAGTILIKICWELRSSVLDLSFFTLIGTLMGIIIIQIAWLRKQQTSNSHTFISVALWIIAFIITIFLYEWLTYVPPPWF